MPIAILLSCFNHVSGLTNEQCDNINTKIVVAYILTLQ